MSWSFGFKGQKKAVKAAVVAYKNPYDVNDADPLRAMEGRHVEEVRSVALDLIDRVPGDDAVAVSAEASGGEWSGGEAHVKVFSMGDLLMNPSEPSAPPA